MASDIQVLKEMKQKYLNVFSGGDGKEILDALKRKAFFYRPAFVSGKPDQSAFNEGQRSIIIHIENMMTIDIDATSKLMEQQKEKEDKDNVQ